MVVVTGATGHVGNVLVRELLSKGRTVRAVILPSEDTSCLGGLKVEMVEGDVRQVDSLIQAFNGMDVVYHLAGIISILPGKRDLLHQVNVPFMLSKSPLLVRLLMKAFHMTLIAYWETMPRAKPRLLWKY